MTIVDNYFPFATGPGATATAARWRLMARVFQGSGVIANYLNNMNPTIAGSVVTIDTGAVWVDGYYGENDSPKTVNITGSGTTVIVVAHMDPVVSQITLTAVASPTQTLTGIYEVPICRVTSGALVDIRQFANGAGAVQPGMMMEHAGGTPPLGWILCNGAQYLRTDYPALFTAIGTSWNVGTVDTNHFCVPDIRGKMTLGVGGGSPLALGQSGGSTTISQANLPPHAHTGGGSGNTGTESAGHDHYQSGDVLFGVAPGAGGSGLAAGNTVIGIANPVTSGENVTHTHSLSYSFTTSNGPGSSSPYWPPTAGVTKVIKT
jgi:microcystin-dependent protein